MLRIKRHILTMICNWHFNRWAHYESKLNKEFGEQLIKEFKDITRQENNNDRID